MQRRIDFIAAAGSVYDGVFGICNHGISGQNLRQNPLPRPHGGIAKEEEGSCPRHFLQLISYPAVPQNHKDGERHPQRCGRIGQVIEVSHCNPAPQEEKQIFLPFHEVPFPTHKNQNSHHGNLPDHPVSHTQHQGDGRERQERKEERRCSSFPDAKTKCQGSSGKQEEDRSCMKHPDFRNGENRQQRF